MEAEGESTDGHRGWKAHGIDKEGSVSFQGLLCSCRAGEDGCTPDQGRRGCSED